MRHMFFAKLFLALMLSLSVSPAFSIIEVHDTMAITNLANQLTQLETQANYLQQQLRQLKPNQYEWSNAQGLINDLGNNIQKSNAIAYSAEDIDKRFKDMFPGYQEPQNYSVRYQDITNTTQNTLNNVLKTLGMSAKDFQDENRRLGFLQIQSQSAVGQTQAIQAASQIASEQVSQLQLLRQTVMSQSTAHATYYAAQIQKEANARAELNEIISKGDTTIGKLDANPIKDK